MSFVAHSVGPNPTVADIQEKGLAAVWDGVMMHKVFFDGVCRHLVGD